MRRMRSLTVKHCNYTIDSPETVETTYDITEDGLYEFYIQIAPQSNQYLTIKGPFNEMIILNGASNETFNASDDFNWDDASFAETGSGRSYIGLDLYNDTVPDNYNVCRFEIFVLDQVAFLIG